MIKNKICSRINCILAGQQQPINNFHKNKTTKDGYESQCKDCSKKYKKILKQQYYNKNKNKSDFEIRNETKEKYCLEKKCKLFRIKQSSQNFYIVRSHKDGLSTYCKTCQAIKDKTQKEKRKKINKNDTPFKFEKNCPKCNQIKTIDYFSKDSTSVDGYNVYCRECSKKKKNSFAMYDRYYLQLEKYEKVRRDPNNKDLIQVCCKNSKCSLWFNPTNEQIQQRLRAINKLISIENNLYCSAKCKNTCILFNFKKNKKCTHNDNLQHELREIILIRDQYTCQKCGKSKKDNLDLVLHCHHIIPKSKELIFSADIDNCITLCNHCHYSIHKNISDCNLYKLKTNNSG